MTTPQHRIGSGSGHGSTAAEVLDGIDLSGKFCVVTGGAPAGGRVVAVSSGGHRRTGIRWDDIQFERGYDKWLAYGQSKTADVLFAVQLDALGQGAGVRALAVHPGGILTPLQRHLTQEEMRERGWIDEHGNQIGAGFKSPEQGAATQAWTPPPGSSTAWAACTARTAT